MIELLAPAGDLECALTALYSGADAIYCAAQRFGARAYAKNLSIDELKELLYRAHEIGKKIYITVNTIIKENELDDCIKFVDELYSIGVDGIICADFAIINHIVKNLPLMEAHISTQVGVKDLSDVLFFKDLGVKRCVLARENTIEEIKKIKDACDMDLEIFAHGALCVSYSGGCLMSSMLTLRSGNRGRCSQNCRREYTLYKDNNPFMQKGFHLSMKDLNTSSSLKELINAGADSLKIEGRMKDKEYVKIVVSEYRKRIDNPNYNPTLLTSIFHRAYTKGFLFGEDRGQIVDITKRSNEGNLVGNIIKKEDKYTKIHLTSFLTVGDRIRISDDNSDDYYFTIDEILDKNKKSANQVKNDICYLNIFKVLKPNSKIYKMNDVTIDASYDNTYKKGIVINVYGSENTPLKITTKIDNVLFEAQSTDLLSNAIKAPITDDALFKQLSKLNDTSFYLKEVNNKLASSLFIRVASINEARRLLVAKINDYFEGKREINYNNNFEKITLDESNVELTAFCVTKEQYEVCINEGIKYVYYDETYSPYVEAKYPLTNKDYVLVGNYGGIKNYKSKELISDYSFNVINSNAVYYLHQCGVKYVTLSLEASYTDISNIYTGYINKFGSNPNLEITIYGRENLMTTKYCPLRRYKQCGICNEHKYEIADEKAKFPIYHTGCITHIINEKPSNLIDNINDIRPFTNRFRLSFTIENKDEVKKIINMAKEKINNKNNKEKYFDSEHDTRGYFKRDIL